MAFRNLTMILTIAGAMLLMSTGLAQTPKGPSKKETKAEDPKQKPDVSEEETEQDPTRIPPRSGVQPRWVVPPGAAKGPQKVGKTLYFEGTLERLNDGAIVITNPLGVELRRAVAEKRGLPVSSVHPTVGRVFRVDHRKGPSETMLKRRMGAKVRLEVIQDRRGNLWVTDVLSPRQ